MGLRANVVPERASLWRVEDGAIGMLSGAMGKCATVPAAQYFNAR